MQRRKGKFIFVFPAWWQLFLVSSNKVLAGGGGGDTDIGIDDEKTLRPSSPPTRAEAFEEFKKSRGKEINIIFLQNKGELHRQLVHVT